MMNSGNKEYAHTLKGAASFALQEWDYWNQLHKTPNTDEREIARFNGHREGMLHAYSNMLNQMTDARPEEDRARVEEVIANMK